MNKVRESVLYVNRYPRLKFGTHRRLVVWAVHT